MKKVTEARGITRTVAECLSPGNKVMGPGLQHHSLPHFNVPQQTQMKPSQVPNLLPHSPSSIPLPLNTPEQSKERLNSQWHPPHPTGPVYPTGIIPNSPISFDLPHLAQPPGSVLTSTANTATSAFASQPTSKEKLGPQHNNVESNPGHFCASQLGPANPTSNNSSYDRPLFPTTCNSPSSQSMKNLNNYSIPFNSRNDQETASNNEKTQRQDHFKSQQHELTALSENFIPAVDLNCTSQKRCRELEDCYENTKKQCLQDSESRLVQNSEPCNLLSTSLVSRESLMNSTVSEISPKTTEGHLPSELECGQPTSSTLSSFKSTQSHSTSSPVHCPNKVPLLETKQDCTSITQNLVKLSLSPMSSDKSVKKGNEENHKNYKLKASKVPRKDSSKLPQVGPVSHDSSHTAFSTPILSTKTKIKGIQMGVSRKLDGNTPKPSSKPSLGSSSGRTADRRKTSRVRRPMASDDLEQLFTPDPMVYVVSPSCKTAKPKTNEETIKSPTSGKSSSPSPGCIPPVTTSSSQMTPHSKITDSPLAESSSACNSIVSYPTVTLKRFKLENFKICSENYGVKNSPTLSSERELKDESVKSHHKKSSLGSTSVSSCASETDTSSSPHYTQSAPLERQASDERRNKVNEEDSIDVELDLGLSIAYDIDLTQNSDSSEEEQLVSFQEIMECVTKPPDTPEKGAFSEPSTPGRRSSHSKILQPPTTKSAVYKNTLDQMLKEINDNKRAKETETQLLTACKEDLLTLAEYEATEDNQEVVSSEQLEFLQRYSLMSTAIREVPPGEAVFDLEKFGQIFNQDTLQLRQCMVNPQGTTQKTLLWSSPAQLKLHLNIGLFQEAYSCNSPCPTQVTRFLFKMMSVHNERMVSEKILEALCDIACSAAHQIVNNRSREFEVWVPSLADVTLVLMNMGAAYVTLYPFEDLQPTFTEGDLLEDSFIRSESPSNNKKKMMFPEHNCSNVIKYLSYCMGLCPRAYNDNELLLLLSIVGRISLETQWILQSRVEVTCLQYKIINNIRDWDTVLPSICQTFTNLTDDHHNMCLLVQLLPDSTRGKQLRRHLSMCLISKLLNGTCTYRPTEDDLPLAELRPYLPRMQPSKLVRDMHQKNTEEDLVIPDQQAYYLCYSLLMLTNEASSFQVFQPHQKAELLVLSSELETHVKCDIRESEKCLYRSKVKDLVARIYTKWQILLQRTRPLNDRLYDYWQPVDTYNNSQEDEEDTVMEVENDEDEDPASTDENNVLMAAENEDKEEIN